MVKHVYIVESSTRLVHYEGDRREDTVLDDSYPPTWEFGTLEEAEVFMDSYEFEEPTIHRTRRGPDSWEYQCLDVWEWVYDPESDEWDCPSGCSITGRSGIPEEYERADDMQRREYYGYLDYKRGHYRGMYDILHPEEDE